MSLSHIRPIITAHAYNHAVGLSTHTARACTARRPSGAYVKQRQMSHGARSNRSHVVASQYATPIHRPPHKCRPSLLNRSSSTSTSVASCYRTAETLL